MLRIQPRKVRLGDGNASATSRMSSYLTEEEETGETGGSEGQPGECPHAGPSQAGGNDK